MKQENNQLHTILDAEYEVMDEEKDLSGATRTGALITALILAGLGLAALIFPAAAGTGLAFFMTAGLFLSGLSQTMLFFQAPKEERSGWLLANGILLLIFSAATILTALLSKFGVLQMISSLSFLLGVLTASTGLNQIISAWSQPPKAPGRGWAITGGVLNLILSVFLCVNPILSWLALTTMWGIYLISAAIALLFALWSTRRKHRASPTI